LELKADTHPHLISKMKMREDVHFQYICVHCYDNDSSAFTTLFKF